MVVQIGNVVPRGVCDTEALRGGVELEVRHTHTNRTRAQSHPHAHIDVLGSDPAGDGLSTLIGVLTKMRR